jgi:carbon starvation protein
MFLFPMAFMMVVTLSSLVIIVKNQLLIIANGAADWGPYAQAGIGILLIALAVVLAVEGCQTIAAQRRKKTQAAD